ncbi:MAG: hypothetical protein LBQ38_13415 [Spirochaetaceae bacterium]|jgi:hypothetical protein|nr:hypothetical protein [Spirochaetaceae bacterium]
MNEPAGVSVFMLERYNLGEISAEEKRIVESAVAADQGLAETLAELRRSDSEIRHRYPGDLILPELRERARRSPFDRDGKAGAVRKGRRPGGRAPLVWGLCAAALVLAFVLPSLLSPGGRSAQTLTDRTKGGADSPGASGGALPTALSIYLKTGSTDVVLDEQAVLRAGNTIQLAYSVGLLSREQYGVIFSIDGRSAVTLHYPYAPGQSTRLVLGKETPLAEAYTLDDAPNYEIFFFVIGDRPLDPRAILGQAEGLARNPGTAAERGPSIFKGYTVKTAMVRKE